MHRADDGGARMLVYRFKPSDRANHKVALTQQESGSNLPSDGAPWVSMGSVDLAAEKPWINAPVADIEKTIAAKGYYVWSIAVPAMKAKFSA